MIDSEIRRKAGISLFKISSQTTILSEEHNLRVKEHYFAVDDYVHNRSGSIKKVTIWKKIYKLFFQDSKTLEQEQKDSDMQDLMSKLECCAQCTCLTCANIKSDCDCRMCIGYSFVSLCNGNICRLSVCTGSVNYNHQSVSMITHSLGSDKVSVKYKTSQGTYNTTEVSL